MYLLSGGTALNPKPKQKEVAISISTPAYTPMYIFFGFGSQFIYPVSTHKTWIAANFVKTLNPKP